jgi:nucleotide-binding universal stress UspA family protein
MARVLIPFSNPGDGERAVRRLLGEPRDPRLDVELLAIVDPLTSGKVAVYVSPAQAEAQARAAATRWIGQLQQLLGAAGVQSRASIAVGPVRETLHSAGRRGDFDRVVLGTRASGLLRHFRRRLVAHRMHRPVVSVS